jgi:hypothetical protein
LAIKADKKRAADEAVHLNALALAKHWEELAKLGVPPGEPAYAGTRASGASADTAGSCSKADETETQGGQDFGMFSETSGLGWADLSVPRGLAPTVHSASWTVFPGRARHAPIAMLRRSGVSTWEQKHQLRS